MPFQNDDNRKFLITFFVLFALLYATDYFFSKYRDTSNQQQPVQKEQVDNKTQTKKAVEPISLQKELPSLKMSNTVLQVQMNLLGGLIDSAHLLKYPTDEQSTKCNDDKSSVGVDVLSKSNSKSPYYVSVTYRDINNKEIINERTTWQPLPNATNQMALKLKNGLNITRKFTFEKYKLPNEADDNYIVTIVDSITNNGQDAIQLSKSIGVFRKNPEIYNYAVVHEGAVVNTERCVKEIKYSKMKSYDVLTNCKWFGFTDKYWLCAVLNFNKDNSLVVNKEGNSYRLSTDDSSLIVVNEGETCEISYPVYIGPKCLMTLNSYEKAYNIDKFDRAIDYGWFFFITKPLLYLVDWLSGVFCPHQWLVIVCLTLLLRMLTYPLMRKSFISIAKMKTIQPKISALQKMYANDKLRLNQELVAIYRKEKISPLSGCLPMLLQAPIFFCLYKVFFISLSMRHAPLFGWVRDLSAPDTCYITNLFGLIDWTPPSFLQIGVWPIIMGITMLIQQKLSSAMNKNNAQNKTPEQKAQEKMLYFMPVLFTYISTSFPVSIIFYWTISNIIGIIQQQYVTQKINAGKV